MSLYYVTPILLAVIVSRQCPIAHGAATPLGKRVCFLLDLEDVNRWREKEDM